MPASLHPLHSLRAFPSKKHNQSPESRPRDPRDGMKIRLNDYLRCAYGRIGEAGRRSPTNRARCIERKIASRDPLSKIIPPRIPGSLVTWPATTRLLARMRSFATTVPSINNRTLPPVFPSPSYRYRTTRAMPIVYRGRVDSSRMQRPRLITPTTDDFWKPRRRVERRAWPAFPLRHSLQSQRFRSRIERYVLPMIRRASKLSFSNYRYTIGNGGKFWLRKTRMGKLGKEKEERRALLERIEREGIDGRSEKATWIGMRSLENRGGRR